MRFFWSIMTHLVGKTDSIFVPMFWNKFERLRRPIFSKTRRNLKNAIKSHVSKVCSIYWCLQSIKMAIANSKVIESMADTTNITRVVRVLVSSKIISGSIVDGFRSIENSSENKQNKNLWVALSKTSIVGVWVNLIINGRILFYICLQIQVYRHIIQL